MGQGRIFIEGQLILKWYLLFGEIFTILFISCCSFFLSFVFFSFFVNKVCLLFFLFFFCLFVCLFVFLFFLEKGGLFYFYFVVFCIPLRIGWGGWLFWWRDITKCFISSCLETFTPKVDVAVEYRTRSKMLWDWQIIVEESMVIHSMYFDQKLLFTHFWV